MNSTYANPKPKAELSKALSNLTGASDEETDAAIAYIKERLTLMRDLNAIFSVSLVPGGKPIIIDAKNGEPKIVESTDEPLDTEMYLSPEAIDQLKNGITDSRYAILKYAFFSEDLLPKGNMRVAIKFGDMLSPINPKSLKHFDGNDNSLPKPTTDLDQIKNDIKKWGFAFIKDAMSPEQTKLLREAVMAQAAGEKNAGVGKFDGGPNAPNQRIWNLGNKGQEFIDLLDKNEWIPILTNWFLGEDPTLFSFSANIARPGNVPMQLHTDQIPIQPPIRSIAFGLNFMWFLTDITEKNGGTRVYPASHLGDQAPDDPFDITGSIAASGPAGTCMVFESRLWHATGPNNEPGSERPVIISFFMRSYIRPQENAFLGIEPKVLAGLSDRVKTYYGYKVTGALGGVEQTKEGTFVSLPEHPVGRIRA